MSQILRWAGLVAKYETPRIVVPLTVQARLSNAIELRRSFTAYVPKLDEGAQISASTLHHQNFNDSLANVLETLGGNFEPAPLSAGEAPENPLPVFPPTIQNRFHVLNVENIEESDEAVDPSHPTVIGSSDGMKKDTRPVSTIKEYELDSELDELPCMVLSHFKNLLYYKDVLGIIWNKATIHSPNSFTASAALATTIACGLVQNMSKIIQLHDFKKRNIPAITATCVKIIHVPTVSDEVRHAIMEHIHLENILSKQHADENTRKRISNLPVIVTLRSLNRHFGDD